MLTADVTLLIPLSAAANMIMECALMVFIAYLQNWVKNGMKPKYSEEKDTLRMWLDFVSGEFDMGLINQKLVSCISGPFMWQCG